MTDITHIDLSNNDGVLPENLATVFPQLQELTLCNCANIFDEFEKLLAVIHSCEHLRVIRIDEGSVDEKQLDLLHQKVNEVIIVSRKQPVDYESFYQCYSLLQQYMTHKDALHDIFTRLKMDVFEANNESVLQKSKLKLYTHYIKQPRDETQDDNLFEKIFNTTIEKPTDHPFWNENVQVADEETVRKSGSTNIVTQKEPLKPMRKIFHILCKIFPFLVWGREYFSDKKQIMWNLIHDMFACVMVTMVLVPQSIAFALVVGVPSQYGLFTAIIPNLIYPFIGTSKTLSPGPTALLSLLTATAVESMGPKSQEETIVYAIFLAIIVGGLQTLLGLFRLGFFVNFLSKPVLSGFTTASVILIIMSQIKHILGLSIPDAAVVQKILYYLGKAMFTPEMKGGDLGVHWPTFAFSLCCFTVYVALSYVFVPFRGTRYYLSKFIPIPLIMVVVSILSIYIVAVSTHAPPGSHVLGIKIVGTVPTGFPSPGIPMMPIYGNTTVNGTEIIGREMISPQTFVELVVIAIPVAIVAFAEGISVAKFYATKDRVQIDPSQELIASGLGCLLGGIFSGYPSTGALARSAINAGAGGVSQFVSLFTGIIMIFVVYFVTPLFYYLPKAFLGVLLILSVWKLIDIGTLRYTFQTRKRDFFVLVAAFLLTCFAGPQWGIIISVILSIALMIYRASRPRFVPLGRVPGSSIYRDLRTNAGVVIPGVLVVRFDSEMFFGNMSYLAEKLRTLRDKASLQLVGTVPNNTHVIVLDMSCVSQIDSSALLALKDIKATLDKDEILWLFAETRPSLMEVMRKGDVIVEEGSAQDGIPETNFFMEVHSAVLHGIEYAKMQAEKEANIEQRVVEDTQSQIELQDIQTDQTLDDTHTEQL